MNARSVLECGRPLPLFRAHGESSTAPKSARGLAHSKTWRRFLAACMTLMLSTLYAHAQQYAVPWFKIAGGGGMQSTGGVYALSGTIGQVDAGRAAATNAFRIEAGFWAIAIQQLGYPPLNITKDAGTNYFVSWLTAEPGLMLQQASALSTPTVWIDTSELVSTSGLTNIVQQGIAGGVTHRFYRLRRP